LAQHQSRKVAEEGKNVDASSDQSRICLTVTKDAALFPIQADDRMVEVAALQHHSRCASPLE